MRGGVPPEAGGFWAGGPGWAASGEILGVHFRSECAEDAQGLEEVESYRSRWRVSVLARDWAGGFRLGVRTSRLH